MISSILIRESKVSDIVIRLSTKKDDFQKVTNDRFDFFLSFYRHIVVEQHRLPFEI